MEQLKETYNLRNDSQHIKAVQAASLHPDFRVGLKMENGLLYGSAQWFEAIENGMIPTHVITGKISKVYMTGHNDFPMFDISDGNNTTEWERRGIDDQYVVGKEVELSYVLQKFKRGYTRECVISIKISE
ncbi:hypothetical protein [Polluticoccus soli]|uniref:hypothetical protein n=1 Tax=Polluticoccus soli TaxID=3034150 RepID=UPI0023E0ACC0|nr:hypothetical protein [Flavipsychrobacter sp. JY13-12]